MGYVVAGYTVVLSILFLYGLQLLWRRRRLTQAVARLAATAPPTPVANSASTAPTAPTAGGGAERS